MKPKTYRKSCKAGYLLMRRRHKEAGFQTKEYLRLVYDNMVWEGKPGLPNKRFNLVCFAYELDGFRTD